VADVRLPEGVHDLRTDDLISGSKLSGQYACQPSFEPLKQHFPHDFVIKAGYTPAQVVEALTRRGPITLDDGTEFDWPAIRAAGHPGSCSLPDEVIFFEKKGQHQSMVDRLAQRFGIEQREKRTSTSQVCSIGFSPGKKKWYGWSHRAVYGYGVGDKAFPDPKSFPGLDHPPKKEWATIKTMDQAKQAAKNFAAYVS
jgi:hypothetical protein